MVQQSEWYIPFLSSLISYITTIEPDLPVDDLFSFITNSIVKPFK